jgi:hypothetical protein
MTACINSTWIVLYEPSEIMKQWSQHFQNLLRDLNVIRITQELGEVLKKIERTEE